MKSGNENALAMAAINEEARKRRMTYGQLMAQLSQAEKAEIIKGFDPREAERRRRESVVKNKGSKRKR